MRISFLTMTALLMGFTLASCNSQDWPEEGVKINGVVWASCNVDAPGRFASKPEGTGMMYQWNSNRAWSAARSVSRWNTTASLGATWEAANDPSPEGWRVPTREEINQLLDETKVSRVWTLLNGVWGYRFTDKSNNNSIFLPSAGYRNATDGTLEGARSIGFYWSGTEANFDGAYLFKFRGLDGAEEAIIEKLSGLSIRPVKK